MQSTWCQMTGNWNQCLRVGRSLPINELPGDDPGFLEADFGDLWWLERGLSAAIGSVPWAPHPTPPIWPVSRTSSTRRGRYPKRAKRGELPRPSSASYNPRLWPQLPWPANGLMLPTSLLNRSKTFNGASDHACHIWRRFYGKSSTTPLRPYPSIVPLVRWRVGIRTRQ
jgi:hypothetical protein